MPVAAGMPSFVEEVFATAARAKGMLVQALPNRPLPPGSLKVELARLTGGATVGSPADLGAVSETDPASALATYPIGLIAGQLDIDRKLFERPPLGFDVTLGEELGAAWGTACDSQIVAGSASSNQLRGLVNVSGILTATWTDGSPSVQEATSRIWSAYSDCAGSSGAGIADPDAYLTIMHPRRLAWLHSGAGNTALAPPVAPELPGTVVPSGGIRTTLGAGTNEDEVFVVARDLVYLSIDTPQFRLRTHEDPGSGTFLVRLQISGYASLVVRQPNAVCRLSGTGLAAPTFP
jgi:hypothetical protein